LTVKTSALPQTPRRRVAGNTREWIIPAISATVAALGCLNIWSAILAHGPGRDRLLRDVVHMPLMLSHGSRTLTIIFGLILLVLARSLSRRKRQAWRLTVPLIAVSPFLHIVKGLDFEEALICLVLLALLLAHRRSFYAQNDKPSARQGAIAALGMFLFAVVYGPAGMWVLRRGIRPAVTLKRAMLETSHVIFGSPEDPVLTAVSHGPLRRRVQWFEGSLSIVCWFAGGYGLFMVLRPVLLRSAALERDRMTMRRLLAEWGGPPLSYFGLLPDKQFLFDTSDTPTWGIAYRLIGRHALALGDPIGDPGRVAEAIPAFLTMCRERDWEPVFYQVTDRYADAYRAARLRMIKVGEDAVIDVPSFSLRGKAFQDLRTAINKMSKTGVTFEEFPTDAADHPDLAQLAEVTDDWLLAHKGAEKNFAMGAFAPGSDLHADSRLFVARQNETGLILAFVSFVPKFGKRRSGDASRPANETAGGLAEGNGVTDHGVVASPGWGLDLMRRRSSSTNGIVDFLIASAVLQFQREGAEIVSLGLSPLAGSFDQDTDEEKEIFERARCVMFDRFNHFYNFKGLNAFKAKFAPSWEPRFLVYTRTSSLIPSAIAALRAHNE
jgi:phosphatidylglycerol lysyltransferase